MFTPGRLCILIGLFSWHAIVVDPASAAQPAIPIVINELMASNAGTTKDPQSQWDDWIELHNMSDRSVDAGGLYLTDDLSSPMKWRIPNATTITARGYLLIWADGDVGDSDLHAGFELAAEGERVALSASDGKTLIDVVDFGQQRADMSFGRSPNGSGTWGYLIAPSPGKANSAAYAGVVEGPTFGRERGFWSEPFDLSIQTATADATIVYTLDGSRPTPTHGSTYQSPIHITTTAVVRAAAFKNNWLQTEVETHTYLFLADVIRQPAEVPGYPRPWTWLGGNSYAYHDYEMDPQVVNHPAYKDMIVDALKAIPTLALAASREDLDTFYWGSGERRVSMELMYPDEPRKNIQTDCGAEPHSHNRMKRSLQLNFRSEYGNARLESALLRDGPLNGDSAAESFDKLVLRGGNNRSWARVWNPERTTYTMDQWYRDTQIAMSGVGSHGTFVHLYINGLYWGLYNAVEQPNAAFAATYLGGEEEDWYSVSHGGSHGGDATRWGYLKGTLKDKDLTVPANYAEMRRYLDVERFVDYLLLSWFVGMTDWPENNWWGANRNDVPGPFVYFGWDAEWSWLTTRGHDNGWVHPDFRNGKSGGVTIAALWHALRKNPDFTMLFADRAYRHLFDGGLLTDELCKQRYLALNDFIRDAVVAESARWGDTCESLGHPTRTRDVDWLAAESEMLGPGFMDGNAARFVGSLRKEGYYPNIDPPVFDPPGGHVPLGSAVTLMNPNPGGDIHYTLDGSDARPSGTAQMGNEVVLVSESAIKRIFVPTGPVSDSWRGATSFNDSGWLDCTGAIGYERDLGYESLINVNLENLMYGRTPGCYIRVRFTIDTDPSRFEALAFRVRYDDGFIAYLNGVEMCRANATRSPAWNTPAAGSHADAQAVDPESFNVFALSHALKRTENILAVHALNESATSSDFLISFELVATEPSPSSSQAIRYVKPIVVTRSVQLNARVLAGETWSAMNRAAFAVGPVAESLRITEIMYHPLDTGDLDDPNREYVELMNVGSQSINLNLVRFTEGIDFVFPDIDLAPGAYTVVVKNAAAFEETYGPGIPIAGQYAGHLDNSGERLQLVDAAGDVIYDFRYRDGWHRSTDGAGHSLVIADLAAPPDSWGQKSGWRPSRESGGSPGRRDLLTVTP